MEIEQMYIKNIEYILIIVFIIISIILFIHLFNINLNETRKKQLLQVVTIEGLENSNTKNKKFIDILNSEPLLLTPKDFINTDLVKDFCKSFQGSSDQLNSQCNRLTKTNCNLSSCCVLLNGESCVAGSIKGPTFLTKPDGSSIANEYYYYQSKCYGNCK